MQDQNKEMHIIDEELFFVIDEKNKLQKLGNVSMTTCEYLIPFSI